MWGLPQKQNARRADKIRLCGHLRRYKKIVKKTYIIYTKFLYYWLNSFSFINQVKIDVGGTAYNALTIDMLKNYLIPLPPLEEQKRIVAKIEELLPFCDQLIK